MTQSRATPATRGWVRLRVKVRARVGLALALAGAVVLIALLLPTAGRKAAADDAKTPTTAVLTPVKLVGEGSWDIDAEFPNWRNDLYGANGAISMSYFPQGGYIGRQDFLAGAVDYVVSGVPFTASELASLPGGASDVISAPIMPSALGVLLKVPLTQGDSFLAFSVNTSADTSGSDATNYPSGEEVYDGPIRVPYENLSAMLLSDKTTQPDGYALGEWDNPEITSTWPQCPVTGTLPDGCLSYDPSAGDTFAPAGSTSTPDSLLRSEPNEDTYYLQELAAEKAPTAWADLQTADKITNPAITETLLPGFGQYTTQGVDLQVNSFATALPAGNANPNDTGEVMAVPPWGQAAVATDVAALAADKQPNIGNVPVDWIEVQNAAGQWVTPSPASIDAAIDAGGAAPLDALNDASSATAYPLTWVDDLYAPAHGLSAAKANAIATVIRYIVTDGQKYTAANNDGQLSPALVIQALNAANKIVLSNCTEPGETVVEDSTPGADAPSTPGIMSIGLMDHCVAAPATPVTPTTPPTTAAPATTVPAATTVTTAAPTTTTTPTTTYTPGFSSSNYPTFQEPTSFPESETSPTVTPTATTTTIPAATTTTPPVPSSTATLPPATAVAAPVLRRRSTHLTEAVAAETLPISPASSGGSFDRLAALAIGAVIYLAARRPVRALLRAVGS